MTNQETLDCLCRLVADGTVFYQKLRSYHWHVRGDRFFVLHEKFEELYRRWADAVDDLAEHIVNRGGRAPCTLTRVLELATIDEDPEIPNAEMMMRNVSADLEGLVGSLDSAARTAQKDDPVAFNLLERLRDETDKSRWMVRAWLD